MNRSYTKNDTFVSNNGIYDALYEDGAIGEKRLEKWLDNALCKLIALLQILTGATARRLARVCGVVVSLIGMIGVAGAIETGRLSLVGGLLLAGLFVAAEYACLRPTRRKKH